MAKSKKKSDQDALEAFIAIAVVIVIFVFVGILNFDSAIETVTGGIDLGSVFEIGSDESPTEVVEDPVEEERSFGATGTLLTSSSLDFEMVTGQ